VDLFPTPVLKFSLKNICFSSQKEELKTLSCFFKS
jgi:hypothetical protein